MTSVDDATLAFLDRHRDERVDAITDRLVETIVSVNANYAASATVTLDDLRLSCHANVDRVLEILRAAVGQEGLPDEDDPVYGAADVQYVDTDQLNCAPPPPRAPRILEAPHPTGR